MTWVEKAIDNLLVRSEGEINSRLEQISFDVPLPITQAKAYCHFIQLDASGNPRVNDLAEFVAQKIVDYSIPKREIDEARDHGLRTHSTEKIIALQKKAAQLFTDLKNTGEGGEMLLYILIQEYLKLPQLISKMSLKTSGNVHYHGVDGIHVKYDSSDDSLVLYWGESKMYKSITKALQECFKSLKGFLMDTFSYESSHERDLQLVTSSIKNNVNDQNLEDLLVRYFDRDDQLSNKLKYKGICFVGFDCAKYPKSPLAMDSQKLKIEIEKELQKWYKNAADNILSNLHLEKYEIHVFLIPFPDVAKFREYFLNHIK
jgi:hypothetical protein